MKKVIAILAILLFITAGCSHNTQQSVSKKHAKPRDIMYRDYVHTFHNAQGQTFHILDGYKRVYQYAKEAEKHPKQENELWNKMVIKPSENKCFSHSPYLDLISSFINSPPQASSKILAIKAKLFAHSALNAEAVEALKKSSKAFPGQGTTTNICIFPNAATNIEDTGKTIGKGRIILFPTPRRNKLTFQGTVAHEYYHNTWMKKYQKQIYFNMLKSIIFEGRAVYFQNMIYPNSFKDSISIRTEQKYWKDVRKHLNSTDGTYNDNVLFGKKIFPLNFGYIVGYHIMKQYVKNHPGATIEDWSKISPEQLYKESGYEKWLFHARKH